MLGAVIPYQYAKMHKIRVSPISLSSHSTPHAQPGVLLLSGVESA